MSKKHNEGQIHVRNTSGEFRPGTTTPPAEAQTNKLSLHEQTYLARGSKTQTPPGEMTAADANAIWPTNPGLEAADIVEVVSGSMHTDEGDSADPSSQG
jgi:hypothetical protein